MRAGLPSETASPGRTPRGWPARFGLCRRALAAGLALTSVVLTSGLGSALAAAPDRSRDASRPAAAQPDAKGTAGTFRIVAFGSSSTQGVGASSPAMTYPAQVERLFSDSFHNLPAVSVVNRGIGGEDIDDMLKRLRNDILPRKPDLVIWQVGSNDPLRGVPLERFQTELRAGIAAIRAAGAEVMLMEPQWCPAIAAVDTSSRFVEAVRTVGAEQNLDVVRRFELMRRWMAEGLVSQRGLIGSDGLHMTDTGYTLLARAVFDEVVMRSPAFRGRMALASAAMHR